MKILEEHGRYNDSMCSEIIDVDSIFNKNDI